MALAKTDRTDEVFAANRARGEFCLTMAVRRGATVRSRIARGRLAAGALSGRLRQRPGGGAGQHCRGIAGGRPPAHRSDRWRVRRKGGLVFADHIQLDGVIADRLGETAVAAGHVALGTVLMIPGDDAAVAAVRAVADGFRGEAGISGLERPCAGTAGRAPLPRLWLKWGLCHLRHDTDVAGQDRPGHWKGPAP